MLNGALGGTRTPIDPLRYYGVENRSDTKAYILIVTLTIAFSQLQSTVKTIVKNKRQECLSNCFKAILSYPEWIQE